MSERIYEALDRHFAKNRLVFWYDPGALMRNVYDGFVRDGIERIELANDEFRVKYRILREKSDGKFLVYSPRPRPAEGDDWMLDLALGHFVFSTDEAAMYQQDLGLTETLKRTMEERISFFRDTRERLEPLAALARPEWGERELLYAMLSLASSRSKPERQALRSIDDILISLCVGEGSQERWKKVVDWKLDGLFFELVRREFGISLDTPEPRGLLLRLFQNALSFQTGERPDAECQRAFVFIDKWRDTKSETERYEATALEVERETNAAAVLKVLSDDRLLGVDLYRTADQFLVGGLVSALVAGNADHAKILERIKERKNAYWYRNDREGMLRAWYDALEAACVIERTIRSLKKSENFGAPSKRSLWDLYTTELHLIDRQYRVFLHAFQNAGSSADLAGLLGKIDDLYLNDYLDPLALRWQSMLDASPALDVAKRQNAFFQAYVDPYLTENKNLFVIISDGLRWEAGAELAERLIGRNRFRVDIEPMVALVPSYTPHGMAALLPHESLTLDPENGTVLIDGVSVNGVEGRSAFLAAAIESRYPGKTARAISADDLLTLSSTEADAQLRDYDLVYVYSDHIDTSSHASDSGVPMAVDREIERIVDLVRRITNLNRSNVLVTADHGFLFSGKASDETYMLAVDPIQGESYRDRRFILGFELAERPGLSLYSAQEPAFRAGASVLVAKGLSKIRRKGSLGRYIHGGATLQELAIPVIRINKARKDDARRVGISVLGSTDITSPSIALKFFQDEPIGGKVLPHRLATWFEDSDGQPLSNKNDRVFDSIEVSDMNRGVALSFAFAPIAKKSIGKEIFLKMCTVAEGGTMVEYRTQPFRLKQLALEIDFF